jgi:hypothetical protein
MMQRGAADVARSQGRSKSEVKRQSTKVQFVEMESRGLRLKA